MTTGRVQAKSFPKNSEGLGSDQDTRGPLNRGRPSSFLVSFFLPPFLIVQSFMYSACVCVHIEGRGQPVSSLLLPRGFQTVNSSDQTWQQAPTAAEPSHWPWVPDCCSPPLYGLLYSALLCFTPSYLQDQVQTHIPLQKPRHTLTRGDSVLQTEQRQENLSVCTEWCGDVFTVGSQSARVPTLS